MKKTKILNSIFWFMVGGFFGVELIKRNVISSSIKRVENTNIEGWLAIHNLYDYIVPYTVFFLLGAIFSFIFYTFFKYSKINNTKKDK